jgi:hypothetical protein
MSLLKVYGRLVQISGACTLWRVVELVGCAVALRDGAPHPEMPRLTCDKDKKGTGEHPFPL